jgi:Uma2 family endonuclease
LAVRSDDRTAARLDPPPALDEHRGDEICSERDAAMAEPANREATYEDLLRVPPPLVAEILYGQLHTHPRPAPRHAIASSALGGALFDPFGRGSGGPGGWWILDEPEIHLGQHVVVPDIAGWRRERMPALPDTAWFALAPDWVCEVLSPPLRRPTAA